jgi:hypothetical protein
MGDNDDLTMAWFILTIAILLYIYHPDLSNVVWIP